MTRFVFVLSSSGRSLLYFRYWPCEDTERFYDRPGTHETYLMDYPLRYLRRSYGSSESTGHQSSVKPAELDNILRQ